MDNASPVNDTSNDNINLKAKQSVDEIDLAHLIALLWGGRWLIILCTFAFTLGGVLYAILSTPIYQADAMVQVEQKTGALPGLSDLGEMFGSESAAATEIELIKSRTVVGETVDTLNLDIHASPNQIPIIGNFLSRYANYDENGLAKPWWDSNYAWGGEELIITSFDVPKSNYGRAYRLQVNDDGWDLYDQNEILILSGNVGEKATAKDHSIFVQRLLARPETSFTVVKQPRLSTVLTLQSEISASEKGKDSGIISLRYQHSAPEHAQAVLDHITRTYVRKNVEHNSAEASKSLEFLKKRLPNVRKDLERAEEKLNAYQIEAESVDVTAEAQALLEQIVELEKSISLLQMQKADIDRRFKPSHPTYQAWERQMQELTERRKEFDTRVSKLPVTHQKVVRLTRGVKVGNEIYLQMLANVQELDIVRAGTVGNVRIVDEAIVDTSKPVAPKKPLIVTLSFLLGGMTSLGWILIRAALNRGIETPEQLEEIGLNVYATIPLSKDQEKIVRSRNKSTKHNSSLLAASHPTDLSIEALRGLRTSIHFAMSDARNNILMITGPSPGVGKSFVSLNFAAIVANSGKKVLVIDADLRRGYLHQSMNLDNHKGLSDVLSVQTEHDSIIQQTQIEGLHIVCRGVSPPNPSELLMSQAMEAFLESMSNAYDLVIVDTPPVLAVTDAILVGRHAGTTMLIVRHGLNSVKEVEWTLGRFKQNGVEVKGTVLNAIERTAKAYGTYSYYGYDYR